MTSMELRVKGVFTGEETEAKLKDRPRSPSHSVAQRGHAPALWNSHSVLFPLGGGCSHDTNDHLKEEPIHPVFQNFLICLFYSFKIENHAGCADTIIKIEKTSCAQRPSLFTPNASPLPGLCPAPPLPHPISKGILNHVYLLKSCLSYKTKKKWTTSPHFKPTPASSSPQLLQLWLPLQFWLPLSLERSAFSFP